MTASQSRSRSRRLPALAAGLAILGVAALGCSGGDDGVWVSGRILQVRVSDMQRVDSVEYQADGSHYVVTPQAQGRELVVAKVLLLNRRSANISLIVDSRAVALQDADHRDHFPVDPYGRRATVDVGGPNEDRFTPFLWSNVEIKRDFQIEGWMIFDVPRGVPISRLSWRTVDSLSAILDFE